MELNIMSSRLGLNVADPLDNMADGYAIQMDNIIPQNEGDIVRKGFMQVSSDDTEIIIPVTINNHERIIGAKEDTLKVYNQAFNVELTKSGYTSSDWHYASFTDGSGLVHTVLTNNSDTPQDYRYNSSNESYEIVDMGFTIPSGVHLDNPLSFKNRLYFIGGDWTIYYGGVQSIAGDLTAFPIGSFFKKGGRIVAITNWTQDAGQGVDDIFVIISSEGEVMLFNGTSPESDDWSTLGVFQIARPIGKNCQCIVGGDIIVATEKGYMPLSSCLSDIRANRTAISQKVDGITKNRDYSKRWQVLWYAKEGWIMINAPAISGNYAYEQHVLNVNTNGWCRFVGMDANCWAVLLDKIYFCNSKGIFRANYGNKDGDEPITYVLQKAYSNFGTPQKKQIMRLVPRYETVSKNYIYKKINSDFVQGDKTLMIGYTEPRGYNYYWDESFFDSSFWSDEYSVNTQRVGVSSRIGSYLSVGFYGQTSEGLTFYSTGAIIKIGNGHI